MPGSSPIELPAQVPGNGSQVHEVAEATSGTFPHLILPAAGLSEVGDGRQLGMHSLPVEPAVIEFGHSPLCILLPAELNVDVAHEVVSEVVTHIHFFNLSVLLLQFREYLLKEVIVVFLHLHVAHVTVRSICGLGCVLWIPVQVEEHYGLAESRFVVESGAPVPVPAGPNLKVKRAVNPEHSNAPAPCVTSVAQERWEV